MFKIKDIEIKNNLVLAPMADVTNSAFRRIVKELGCGLIYAEMVNDKAICYNNEKTIDMLYMTEMERPITQQIFGSDKDTFVTAAKFIESHMKPDIIDINMGCPVPKIAIKSQAGSALLKDPNKVYEIVSAVVDAVSVPVTVKIRSGWDNDSINAVEIAKIIEKAGASAVCVHGRTRKQMYTGKVNLDIIKEVKEAVNIPVIGNGDVDSIESYLHMLEYTKCDAVMIGRAALNNPYVFKEISYFLKTGKKLEITYDDKINMCIKHINYLSDTKNEKEIVLTIRKHIAWYLKGLKGSPKIKQEIFKTMSIKGIIEILENYRLSLGENLYES